MNQKEAIETMVRKQCEIIGIEFRDEIDPTKEFIAPDQYAEWKAFCIDLIRTKLRWPKWKAEKGFGELDLQCGFVVRQNP